MVVLRCYEAYLADAEMLRGQVVLVGVSVGGDLLPLNVTMLRSAHIVVQHDLDGDQHGRGEYKKQSDRVERRIEGDHDGLTDHGSVQQANGSLAGRGIHPS